MKKFLLIFITALLCLTLAACAIECAHNDADGNGVCDACGDATGATPPSNNCTSHTDANKDGKCDSCGAAVSSAPTEDKVELVKDGSAQFQVVMDTETSVKNIGIVKSAVDKINLRLSGAQAEMFSEAQSTEQVYEILVGSVASRGDAYVFDKHDYGSKGYIVKIIGSKICVVAGSDDALEDAHGDLGGDKATDQKRDKKQNSAEIVHGKAVNGIPDVFEKLHGISPLKESGLIKADSREEPRRGRFSRWRHSPCGR